MVILYKYSSHTRTDTNWRTHTHTHMHTLTYTHTNTHINTHTHTHTHTHMLKSMPFYCTSKTTDTKHLDDWNMMKTTTVHKQQTYCNSLGIKTRSLIPIN